MRRALWDIETNGLLTDLDTVHSLCIKDLDTGQVLSCTDDPAGRAMGYAPIAQGLEVLANAERIYGHNIIRFDIPALKKVYPDWDYKGEVFDTLVAVSFRFAHQGELDHRARKKALKRKQKPVLPGHLVGLHGLEAWGHRLGIYKGEYQLWCKENGIEHPFAVWRPEMQTYCEQDLEVNEALIQHLRKAGIPQQALDIEHRLAWYLAQQERNGWPFDIEKAEALHAELAARKQELADQLIEEFGWWYKPKEVVTPKRTIQYKASKTRPCPELIVEGAPYTKLKREQFNPGSRLHIAKVLKERYGWEPTEFTDTGLPEISEEVLEGLRGRIDVSGPLIEYLTLDKRLGQLVNGRNAWLKLVRTDSDSARKLGIPLIHHEVKQNNCVTHRASHVRPNAAQVPKVDSPYGKECRELWTVPKGGEWVQLGADMDALELRCLAHYMAKWDGGAYGQAILEGKKEEGTDVHSLNRDTLRQTELPKSLQKWAPVLASISRNDAKNFISNGMTWG